MCLQAFSRFLANSYRFLLAKRPIASSYTIALGDLETALKIMQMGVPIKYIYSYDVVGLSMLLTI